MIATGFTNRRPGSEKFAPAVKHLNVMYASKRAKISHIRDPEKRAIETAKLAEDILATKERLMQIDPEFEKIDL